MIRCISQMLKKFPAHFKQFLIREKHILTAFGITVFSLTVFAVAAGLAPFGEKSLLAIDLHGQYYPMMAEKLSDFFGVWSWNGGLGFSAVAQSAYYTNSVFLVMLLPFSGYARLAALDVMIFLKLALSSAAFAYYLGKKFERNDIFAGIFGAAYGLGAYTLAFISQPMWLDIVLLLPLILRALEHLTEGGNPLPYTLLLALAIFSNFYISFALCIFLVLWFFVCALTQKKCGFRRFIKNSLKFAGASAASGLLCACMLIPLALHMENWISSSIGFAEKQEWYHSLAEIADAFSVNRKSSLEFGVANLFCSSVSIFLAILFLLNTRISLKKRIALFSLAVLLFVSFEWNLLDFIWHGLHFPNQLPGRQSFLFIFVMLLMGYEAVIRLRELCLWKLCVSLFASAGFLLLGMAESQNRLGRYLSVFVIVTVFVLLACEIAARKQAEVSRLARAGLALVLTADICMNAIFVLCMYGKATNAVNYVKNEEQMLAYAQKYESGNDGFHRTELTPVFTFNPGQLYGYRGISYYSSTMNGNIYRLMERLGNRVYAHNVSTIYMPTPFQDMMFGVKYHYLTAGTLAYAKRLEKSQGISVYESPWALPVAYAVSTDIKKIESADETGLALQERFIRLAADSEKALIKNAELLRKSISNGSQIGGYLYARDEQDSIGYTMEFKVKQDGYFFLEFDFTVGTYEVTINEGRTKTGHCGADQILNTEYLQAGDRVTVTVTVSGYSGISCGIRGYSVDKDALSEAYQKLLSEAMQVEYASDTEIRGTVTLKKDGILYASIPAESGWEVYVDGKKTEIYDLGMGLIFCDIGAGTHTVEYRYRAPGLALGVAISSVTALMLCGVGIYYKKKRRKESIS